MRICVRVGELDTAEFNELVNPDGAHDAADVSRLFGLLDEDGGGTIECAELAHALRTNPEAQALAENFEALHDIIQLSGAEVSAMRLQARVYIAKLHCCMPPAKYRDASAWGYR